MLKVFFKVSNFKSDLLRSIVDFCTDYTRQLQNGTEWFICVPLKSWKSVLSLRSCFMPLNLKDFLWVSSRCFAIFAVIFSSSAFFSLVRLSSSFLCAVPFARMSTHQKTTVTFLSATLLGEKDKGMFRLHCSPNFNDNLNMICDIKEGPAGDNEFWVLPIAVRLK